jgi:hypothetical protein
MSEQRRRRLRPNPPPRRVGEPNVLSDQAIPNRLSTSTKSASAPSTPVPVPVRPAAARPTTATGRPAEAPADDEAPRRRRVPSLSTLIFVGFLVFTAARFLNNMGEGGADPTTAPRPTAAPGATAPPGPAGVVSFGTSLGDDCELDGVAGAFSRAADVWWRADLETVQSPDADALVVTFHDDAQIGREFVAADPEFGEWSVLCAGKPTMGASVGRYRVEVWDGPRTVLLATGVFERKP